MHMDGREERRKLAVDEMIISQKDFEKAFETKQKNGMMVVRKEDLALLRQFIVDKEKGRKLEPRWGGPYLVIKEGRLDVLVALKDLHFDKVKGRYSVDDVKLYVKRSDVLPGFGTQINMCKILISCSEPSRELGSKRHREVNLTSTWVTVKED